MQDAEYIVVTFYTTAEAMATEKVCKMNNIEGQLIPAPPAYAADCGIAWRSPAEEQERLKAALEEADIETEGVHLC